MLKIIGKIGCVSCVNLKEKLTDKGVKFEYVLLDNLENDERRYYASKARAAGKAHMPIILKNDEVIGEADIDELKC